MKGQKSPAELLAKKKTAGLKAVPFNGEWLCTVANLRGHHNFTIADVERATGVSRLTIMNAEKGRGVNLETAFVLAKFFGKSIEEIWQPVQGGEA